MDNELVFEGKKYVKTKVAADEFGYTSDYIGQLARSGKILSRMVGRSRFVEYDSIKKYADKHNGKVFSSEKKNAVDIEKISDVEVDESEKPEKPEKPEKLEEREEREKVEESEEAERTERAREPEALKVLDDTGPLRPEPVRILSKRTPTPPKVKEKEHRQVVHKFVAIAVAFAIVAGGMHVFLSSTRDIHHISVHKVEENVLTSQLTAANIFSRAWERLNASFVRFVATLRDDGEEQKPLAQKNATAPNDAGIVVAPSTGDEVDDESFIEQVRKSFSDQVQVEPDEDNLSGVIKPVFRETVGEDYLYVLVPVNEEEEEEP